jgi:hypothetical protein
MKEIEFIINKQVEDPKLWPIKGVTEQEDYVNKQLRILHAAVEFYLFKKDTLANRMYLELPIDPATPFN